MEAEQPKSYRVCPALGAGALATLGPVRHEVAIRGEGREAEELERLLTGLPEVRVERLEDAPSPATTRRADLVVDFADEREGGSPARVGTTVGGDHARFLSVTLQAVLDRREGLVRNRCARCAAEYCFGALGQVLVDQIAVLARHGSPLLPDLPAVDPVTGAYRAVATACYLQRRLEALRERSEPFTLVGVAAGDRDSILDPALERRLGRRLNAWARGRAFLGHLSSGRFAVVLPTGPGVDLLVRGRKLVETAAGWEGIPPLAVGVEGFTEGTADLDGFGLAADLEGALGRLEPGTVEQLRV